MKRKFKLIASILSLTMSMAFLAFGIYAAANKTATITGSVSFASENVEADVAVYRIAPQATKPTTATTGTLVGTLSFGVGKNDTQTQAITDGAFQEGAEYFGIKIVITNKFASRGINLTFTDKTAATPSGNKVIVDLLTSGTLTSGVLAGGASYTLVYTYQLNGVDQANFTQALPNLVISMTRLTE
jgi:hypothetical protein